MSLDLEKVKDYWKKRATEQEERTVGFCGADLEQQVKNYQERKEFIFKYLPDDKFTLEFGCGIGRYRDMFKSYIGCDITEDLIEMARKRNPFFTGFHLLEQPYLTEDCIDVEVRQNIEMIFTATVLQHNSDNAVHKIIDSFRNAFRLKCIFAFYENNHNIRSAHVKSRTSTEYKDIVDKYYDILDWKHYGHIIHGERHTLSIFKVRKLQ